MEFYRLTRGKTRRNYKGEKYTVYYAAFRGINDIDTSQHKSNVCGRELRFVVDTEGLDMRGPGHCEAERRAIKTLLNHSLWNAKRDFDIRGLQWCRPNSKKRQALIQQSINHNPEHAQFHS